MSEPEAQVALEEDASTREGGVVPGEITASEEKARAGGWRPQEEWEGDPDDWVDHKEFNFRGDLMSRISSQSKTISKYEQDMGQMKQTLNDLIEHNRKLAEIDRDAAIKGLKQQKRAALEEGDMVRADELDDEIDELKAVTFDGPATQEETNVAENQYAQQIQQDFQRWLASPDSKWYQENAVLRGAADAYGAIVHQEMPHASFAEKIAATEKKMKEDPDVREVFNRFKSNGGKSRSQVNSPSGKSGRQTGKLAGKLDEMQVEMGKRFVNTGAFESLEQYAEQLQQLGELN